MTKTSINWVFEVVVKTLSPPCPYSFKAHKCSLCQWNHLWAPQTLHLMESIHWTMGKLEVQKHWCLQEQFSTNDGWSWRINTFTSSSLQWDHSEAWALHPLPEMFSGIESQLSAKVAQSLMNPLLVSFPSLSRVFTTHSVSWDISLCGFFALKSFFWGLLLGYTI